MHRQTDRARPSLKSRLLPRGGADGKPGVIAIPAIAALLVLCFFLPSIASASRDGGEIGGLRILESQSITYESIPDLDLLDRMGLITNSEPVGLDGGQRFVLPEDAFEHGMSELRRLNASGLFEFDFSPGGLSLSDPRAEFVINPSAPAYSMVIWRMTAVDRLGHSVTVALDDETGVILQLFYRTADAVLYDVSLTEGGGEVSLFDGGDALYISPEALGEAMSAYYGGYDVTITDFEDQGLLAYYAAELRREDKVIAAYGLIRGSGFSINE